MRTHFDEQLEKLHLELIRMGALCEDAISAAAKALLEQDPALAAKAQEAEEEIDRAEGDVERLCMQLLLRQQPVAKDLREVSSALKMISDLERIGDQAADIAEQRGFLRSPGSGAGTLRVRRGRPGGRPVRGREAGDRPPDLGGQHEGRGGAGPFDGSQVF